MIIKFFKSNNNPKGTIDYLTGKDRDRDKAKLLQGDIDLSLKIAESLEFSNRYTAGCLSFEESNITENQKKEIMDRFEQTFLAGLESDQYNILWVEHRDKDRLELNFFIPNVELSSQKRLQPYYDRADRPLAENFKQVINHEYHLSDPNAPEKKQTIISRHDLPKDKKEALNAINDGLMALAQSGHIKDRNDVIDVLEKNGFEISRKTKNNISIKTDGQNLRLKGAFYEQDFRFSKDFPTDIRNRSTEYKRSSQERYQTARERLNRAARKREQEYRKKYQRRAEQINQENYTDVSFTDDYSYQFTGTNLSGDASTRVDGRQRVSEHDRLETISPDLQRTIEKYISKQMQITERREQNLHSNGQELHQSDMGSELQNHQGRLKNGTSNPTFRESIKRVIGTAREHARTIIEKVRGIGTRERINKTAIQSNNGAIDELKQHTIKIKELTLSLEKQKTHRRSMSR